MHTNARYRTLLTYTALILLFLVLGIAGTSDYDEYVIMHMPQETYEQIYAELEESTGTAPSQHDIVIEYKNRSRK